MSPSGQFPDDEFTDFLLLFEAAGERLDRGLLERWGLEVEERWTRRARRRRVGAKGRNRGPGRISWSRNERASI